MSDELVPHNPDELAQPLPGPLSQLTIDNLAVILKQEGWSLSFHIQELMDAARDPAAKRSERLAALKELRALIRDQIKDQPKTQISRRFTRRTSDGHEYTDTISFQDRFLRPGEALPVPGTRPDLDDFSDEPEPKPTDPTEHPPNH